MLTSIAAGLGVAAALAQPAEVDAAAPAPVQRPAPVVSPAPAATTSPAPTTSAAPAVSDAAWDALVGRNVEVQTNTGPLRGELLRSEGAQVVIVRADGSVVTTPKSAASSVKVVQPPAPAPAPEQQIAALDAPSDSQPPVQDEDEDEGEDEELTEAQKRRKERRDKREHALLGAFSMHGATYSHWRGDGVNGGHASYAMDWGVGVNFSKNFGIYAIAGGLFGAKIQEPDDEMGNETSIKANYGRVGGLFAFGGQWYYTTVGAGAGFSRLRFADGTLQRDKGLAIPSKIMARIPLPKKLKKYYLGVGLTYELALIRNFGRSINAIGGQIVVGRW
ncbi:MAG: hypothetical protein ACRBN8_15615 [Nannocystales bacterium]